MSETLHLPVLRFGRPYESLDRLRFNVDGQAIEVSLANSGLIRRDLKLIPEAVRRLQAKMACIASY